MYAREGMTTSQKVPVPGVAAREKPNRKERGSQKFLHYIKRRNYGVSDAWTPPRRAGGRRWPSDQVFFENLVPLPRIHGIVTRVRRTDHPVGIR